MYIDFRSYINYKLINSIFTGMAGGSVFIIYGSLSPSIFSLGGIALAVALMLIAYYYHKLMDIRKFFYLSMMAEIVMLVMVCYFLLFSHHIATSLIIYIFYQLSFMLGGYLIRAETHFAKRARLMGYIDAAKQKGYMAGLALSWIFYNILEYYAITDSMQQVYRLHFILLFIEIVIIATLFRSFRIK